MIAAALCGAAAWGAAALLPEGDSVSARLLRGLLPVGVGGLAYAVAGRLLGSPEIVGLLRRGRRTQSLDSDAGTP